MITRRPVLLLIALAVASLPARASHEAGMTFISVGDEGFAVRDGGVAWASPGDTVRWTWSSGNTQPHTVTSYEGQPIDSGLRTTGSFDAVFGGEDILYRCELHSTLEEGSCDGMCGLVTQKPPSPEAPVITSPATGWIAPDSLVSVSGTAHPSHSSIVLYEGDDYLTSAVSLGEGWAADIGPLAQGTHTIVAVASDRFGRTSPASEPLTITVDDVTPPPPPEVSWPPPGWVYGDRLGGVSVWAPDRDIADVIIRIDGAVVPWLNRTGVTFSAPYELDEGDHVADAIAVDLAGNHSVPTAPVHFVVDLTSPTIDLDAPAHQSVVRSPLKVEGTAADTRVVAWVGVQVDLIREPFGPSEPREADCPACGTQQTSWSTTLTLLPGVYRITALAWDGAREARAGPITVVVI